jgi:ADP-ribose diphosphatase
MKLLSEVRERKDYYSILKRTYEMNGKNETYDIIDEGDGVTILGQTDSKIILIRQFKAGANKLLHQLPAGIIDANENPEDAAQREFAEETGYECTSLVKLGTVYKASNRMANKQHLFFAMAKKKGKRSEQEEDIQSIELLSYTQFEKLLKEDLPSDVPLAYLLAKDQGLLKDEHDERVMNR